MIVTVVTPTLNGAAYIAECIDSVKRNHGPGYEVDHVIVDGGSTDGTVELARKRGARVREGRDDGIFDAINKGSFESKGDLLGFLGADDVMLDGALAAVTAAHRRRGRRWIVGGIRWIDDKGARLGELAAPPSWMTTRMHVCLGWNPIMHMSTYITRDFFTELGGFDKRFRDSGDYDLFARALARAPYERVARPLTCFRRTGENNSAVHTARTSAENRSVRSALGPRSEIERMMWRAVLKAWMNGRNPGWMAAKFAGAAQYRLGLQKKAYF
ncbi:glycosyltransferase family 2 protein [Hansschlegelia zhihuaiae]|uniref:Glycosyltransferase n=1 Tax=Hansschlegelia zhihuaiae TaxID=405005 RepID=A0A4Q0MCW9_9HYPH|nr:glycosyltransferase family 2 protein [Hansschlegelia zhihuaiae]RXF70943.1 glycosyltransferase [Hansschlegelia zhihuaiae]